MRKNIDRVLEKLLIAIIAIILIAVIWQVISRYLLGSPSTLTDEIASYGLIWLGLYGAAYASGKELHLAIDLIPVSRLKKAPLIFDGIVALAVIIFALLVMVAGGINLCRLTFLLEQKSAALEIPLGYIYSAIPISGVLIIYYAIDNFRKRMRLHLKNNDGLYGSTHSGN